MPANGGYAFPGRQTDVQARLIRNQHPGSCPEQVKRPVTFGFLIPGTACHDDDRTCTLQFAVQALADFPAGSRTPGGNGVVPAPQSAIGTEPEAQGAGINQRFAGANWKPDGEHGRPPVRRLRRHQAWSGWFRQLAQ